MRKFTPIIVIGISPSWFSVVKIVVKNCGTEDMKSIYEMIEAVASDKVLKNTNWKAKVRQQVQRVRKINRPELFN